MRWTICLYDLLVNVGKNTNSFINDLFQNIDLVVRKFSYTYIYIYIIYGF